MFGLYRFLRQIYGHYTPHISDPQRVILLPSHMFLCKNFYQFAAFVWCFYGTYSTHMYRTHLYECVHTQQTTSKLNGNLAISNMPFVFNCHFLNMYFVGRKYANHSYDIKSYIYGSVYGNHPISSTNAFTNMDELYTKLN